MTDEQERPIACAGEGIERFARVHVPSKRWIELEQLALGVAQLLKRELGGLASSHLWAHEDPAESDPHPRQCAARNVRLALAALGQAPLGILTRTVRLRIGMTKKPELASHSHGVLRA